MDSVTLPESAFFQPWYTNLQLPEGGHGNSVDFNQCTPALLLAALRSNGEISLFEAADEGACELEREAIYKFIESLKARLVWSDIIPAYRSLWVWDDGACFVTVGVEKDKTTNVTMRVCCARKEVTEAARNWMKGNFKARISNGRVHVMISTPNGLQLKSMGIASEPFVRNNYDIEVLDGVDHVIADLRREDPCGRISIIDGPPGTGKTFLIRAIVNEIREALFVMVPANSVSSLGDPGVIKLLIDLKEENDGNGERPIIIILEDADSALGARGSDNMAMVSTLLNFGDGLFGKLMDTRIISTTNAKIGDLDEAITRPGRLCKHIHVGALTKEHAQEVYDRITLGKGKKKFTSPAKLSEVYREARGDGWVPTKAKTGVGFHSDEPTSESDIEVKQMAEIGIDFIKAD